MPAGDYLLGLACFAAMLIATVGGAWLLLGKRFGHLTGPARGLALATLATCGVLAVHLVPGILGLLGRGSVLAASLLWLGAATLVPRGRAAPPAGDPRPEPEPVSRALAGVAVAAIALFAVAFAHNQLVLAPGSIDILNFHLPGVGRWLQTGSLWDIHNYVPDTAAGNYPNNGDVLLLAAVLPWHSDFLSHLVPYLFYGLTGLSVYAVAAEAGAPRAAAASAACLVLAIPVVAVPALVNSFPDVVMLFGFGTGLLFLLRHRRTGATSDLALAGLAFGISFGTKWYAVSAVAVAIGVWVVARLLERRRWRPVARDAVIVVGLILLAGGFWLVRNWAESGNPFFPVKVELLGVTIFDAPRDTFREAIGYSLAHYLTDWSIWREWIVPQYRDSINLPGTLLAAGLLVVIGLACRRPARERFGDPGLLVAGIACALLLLGVYAITPYTAGGADGMPVLVGPDARYAIPALLVAAVLIAWATCVHRLAPAVLGAIALVGMFFGLRLASNGKISGGVLGADDWAWALLIVGAVAAAAWGATRLRGAPSGRPLLLGVAAAVALAALAGFGGWRMQNDFIAKRYAGLDPTTDWIRQHAPPGSRIGVASTWGIAYAPPLPAFGPRFDNEVTYVGPVEDGMLREYSDGRAFGDALDRGDFDYLIVGRGDLGGPPAAEERWARDAGWRFVLGSSLLRLFRAPEAPG
jgi:4-amino-4-deoxy-L-arabinose transferase-like glycosyltransferase